MAEKKTIAVVGATGLQGGGLVRAILNQGDGEYAARALTRDPSSEKARELAQLGAEVVAVDIGDGENLKRAFDGAYGAFCVTFFWAHFSPERELAEATAMANAARDVGLKHVIWSTLEDTRQWVPLEDDRMPTLMGNYKVPHLDAKGEADHIFVERTPATCLRTSFYWDNFINFGMGPKSGPDGKLAITFPIGDAKLPGIAAEDIGKCALGILRRPGSYVGRTVGIAGEHPTGAEMAEAFSRALGQKVAYNSVPPAVYRGFGFPGAEDLGNMFQFMSEFEEDFCQARSSAESRELNPELQTLDQWLQRNISRIPID